MDKLLARLPRRFDLLSGGDRDAGQRQATLRGAIEWSWELLTSWEKSAMAQCSVFRSGFTLEAAEEVVNLEDFPEAPWVPDVIQSLREKSLIRTYEPPEFPGELRFGMYQSIRKFAATKLETTPNRAETLLRHAEYYLELAAPWAQMINTHGGVERLRHLSMEQGNLVAVCRQALEESPSVESAGRAMRALLILDPVLSTRGPYGVQMALTQMVLDHAEKVESADPVMKANIHKARGRAARARGQLAEAGTSFQCALQLARDHDDGQLQGEIVGYLGTVHELQGDLDQARTLYQEALLTHRETGNRSYEGLVLGSLGVLNQKQGRIKDAQSRYEQALSIFREVGNRRMEGTYLGNLGTVLQLQQQWSQAEVHYEQALDIHRELGNKRSEGLVHGYMGGLAHEEGDWTRAEKYYRSALSMLRAVGDRRFEALFAGYLGVLREEADDLDLACAQYEQTLDVLTSMGDKRLRGIFLAYLAGARVAQGLEADAELALDEAQALLDTVGDPLGRAAAEVQRGRLELLQSLRARDAGDKDEAARLKDSALQRRAAVKDQPADELTPADRSADVRFALRLFERTLTRDNPQ
jgi:tetratricopeptide (TPR) repeat protein